MKDNISTTRISISTLNSQTSKSVNNFISFNKTTLDEYNKKLNIYANIREYLINFTSNLIIVDSNSIILQASSLVQLTKSTNQLTRLTLVNYFILFSKIFFFFLIIDNCFGKMLPISCSFK